MLPRCKVCGGSIKGPRQSHVGCKDKRVQNPTRPRTLSLRESNWLFLRRKADDEAKLWESSGGEGPRPSVSRIVNRLVEAALQLEDQHGQ
jgi:hypothetical protein